MTNITILFCGETGLHKSELGELLEAGLQTLLSLGVHLQHVETHSLGQRAALSAHNLVSDLWKKMIWKYACEEKT